MSEEITKGLGINGYHVVPSVMFGPFFSGHVISVSENFIS
jgi:hypothetical protein